ncbi:MAG: deoxyribonuclease IV [Patescibacteria group bacterium]
MLGATVPTRGGIHNAFKWGDNWSIDAVQFYLTLSRQWKVNHMTEEEKQKFRDAWNKSNVKEVVAHIPYLVNLTSATKSTREKSVDRMISEIKRAKELGVKYLVLHPGSPGKNGKEKGMKFLKEGFDKVFKEVNPEGVKILIETMAGQGTSLGSTFEEVKEILDLLNKDKVFSVCFDSAHVLEAGYDIRGEEGYENILKEFKKYIPLNKIDAFHLNDSKTEFNSNSDRHEHIGEGEIGLSFFKKLLNDDHFKDIPKIIETPNMGEKSEYNLKTLKSLYNG